MATQREAADARLVKRLVRVRNALDLSQRKFAARLGILQQNQCRYELGHWRPSIPYLERLAALGVSLDWFITGVGDMWRTEPPEIRGRASR